MNALKDSILTAISSSHHFNHNHIYSFLVKCENYFTIPMFSHKFFQNFRLFCLFFGRRSCVIMKNFHKTQIFSAIFTQNCLNFQSKTNIFTFITLNFFALFACLSNLVNSSFLILNVSPISVRWLCVSHCDRHWDEGTG